MALKAFSLNVLSHGTALVTSRYEAFGRPVFFCSVVGNSNGRSGEQLAHPNLAVSSPRNIWHTDNLNKHHLRAHGG